MKKVSQELLTCVPVVAGYKHLENSMGQGFVHHSADCYMPFIVQTLDLGISQWSTGELSQWQGLLPGLSDIIGLVVFTTFQEQQYIGWDQAIRYQLCLHLGKSQYTILPGVAASGRLHHSQHLVFQISLRNMAIWD